MSRFPFPLKSGPIYVDAEITGPFGSVVLKLVLDTGATTTVIKLANLLALGFDPNQAARRVPMTTGSVVTVVTLTRLSALGQHRFGFPVLAHPLPAAAAIDGLLGLDFFRGHVLTIDFPAGQITLA